ncbi:cytochrome P450 6B5 [Linepithema humile]|uniref:cytochrome P450 6B5 n=1 Tax=Linepithema humile TaxID=83485 RepID=UPI00351EAF89
MLGFLEILYVFIAFFIVLYYYYKIKFNFWKKRGIPGPKPILFFGNTKDVILRRMNIMDFRKELYNKYRNEPLIGFFDQTEPFLFVNDPELIKDVLITDSAVFAGRGSNYSEKADPLDHHIFYMKTDKAQPIRAKVSPMFTPSKLRSMVPICLERSKNFKDWLDTLLSRNEEINYSDMIEKYISDLSTTCLFGYDLEALKDGENKVLQQIRKAVSANTWKNICKSLLPNIVMQNKLYDLIGYYMFGNAQEWQFFTALVKNIDSYRKKHGIDRHDLTNVIMGLKQNEITDQLVVANIFAFMAASETSSATATNTMYELALNQSIQDKLREEIKSVRASNKEKQITYDDINTMSYLDAVFKETLRKYPIADVIGRQAISCYTFRNSKVTIPKNQLVGIPVCGIHYNPDIYPKPEVYDPERFIDPKTKNSMHYFPFGHGPRNCIGERFGILETKIVLITIIENYKVEPCENTKMIYNWEKIVQQTRSMYLKLTKIN